MSELRSLVSVARQYELEMNKLKEEHEERLARIKWNETLGYIAIFVTVFLMFAAPFVIVSFK